MTIDKKQFEQHLFEPESSFEILLRGHLWIESLINSISEVHIVDAKSLDLDRATFRQKVDIAQAFGFITSQGGAALRALNRLRNRLAHNLTAEPNEDDIRELCGISENGMPRNSHIALGGILSYLRLFKKGQPVTMPVYLCFRLNKPMP